MDNDKLVICRKCIEDFKDVPYTTPFQYRGLYTNFKVPDDNLCNICKEKLYTTKVTKDEIKILFAISHDNDFLKSMIDLKEKDPIEYQLKLSQFKTQVQQQENNKKQQSEQSKVHCPYCNSINVKKISDTERVASVAMMGIFSKKINKSFKCNNCGGTF